MTNLLFAATTLFAPSPPTEHRVKRFRNDHSTTGLSGGCNEGERGFNRSSDLATPGDTVATEYGNIAQTAPPASAAAATAVSESECNEREFAADIKWPF